MDLAAYLRSERALVDDALDRLLPPPDRWPARLHDAMRYAVFGGGKRIRPILARAACRAAGADPAVMLEAACALELVHTYSLVHDDLPALDNDALRRGRATVHVAYDEPLAIMVGDALLTEGFLVLATHPEGPDFAARRAEACRLVAKAVGSVGMVGGQVEDLQATGQPPDAGRLDRIHRAKTGALLGAAVELGAQLAGVDDTRRGAFSAFGRKLGLLFQVSDDILDVTGTAASLGKSPGKDASAGKVTFPAVYGLREAIAVRDRLAHELGEDATALEGADGVLGALVDYVATRDR